MKSLIKQAENDKITEESAERINALLNNVSSARASTSAAGNSLDGNNDLLNFVSADADAAQSEDVIQALKRTEATISEKRCYLFGNVEDETQHVWPQSASNGLEGWQDVMADSRQREKIILSGFAKDMCTIGDTLPDEVFLWLLEDMCFQKRIDLRQAYCDCLLASPQQISRLIRPKIIKDLFSRLGGKGSTTDVNQKLQPVPVKENAYEGKDWTSLVAAITFLGRIADDLPASTKSYTLSLLARLCADRVMLENANLIYAFQKSMEALSESIDRIPWEQCVSKPW
jgi:hypothetical protein